MYPGTSSGTFGTSTSDKAQRGTDTLSTKDDEVEKPPKPERNNRTSLSGVDLKEDIQDAIQGRDKNSHSSFNVDNSEDVWGVEQGAEKDF